MYCEVVILGLTMCYKRIRAEIREGGAFPFREDGKGGIKYGE